MLSKKSATQQEATQTPAGKKMPDEVAKKPPPQGPKTDSLLLGA